MIEAESSQPQRALGASLIGVLLAGLVFVVVWFVGGFLFTLFDHLRGLGNDRLQAVFRLLFVPGVGGHFALVVVDHWIPRASMRGVFFGFSGLLFILVGVYIGLLLPVAGRLDANVWEMLVPVLVLASGIVGAYIKAKERL